MNRSRRNFFITSSVLVTGLIVYQKRQVFTDFFPQDQARSNLLSFLRHRTHAAVIGDVYLTQNPQIANEEILMRRLSDFLLIDLSSASKKDIEKRVLRSVKEDYKKGQTVILDGWVLSRTEAVLAGLAAVTRQKSS